MVIVAAHQDIYVGRMVNGLTGPTSELLQTHLVLTEMAGRCRSGRTTLWSRPARSSGGSRLSALAATSPNARADVDVAPDTIGGSSATRIRLGDPKTTYQNQHRYVLTYVLPNARLTSHRLQVNIIGSGEEFETGRLRRDHLGPCPHRRTMACRRARRDRRLLAGTGQRRLPGQVLTAPQGRRRDHRCDDRCLQHAGVAGSAFAADVSTRPPSTDRAGDGSVSESVTTPSPHVSPRSRRVRQSRSVRLGDR